MYNNAAGRDTTDYFKSTIIEALNDKSCPICDLVQEREDQVIWWYFTDNYNDRSTLKDLMENSFVCEYHANIFASKDHSSLSFIFQFLVNYDISRLNTLSKSLQTTKNDSTLHKRPISTLINYWQAKHTKRVEETFQGYTSCRFCKLNEAASSYVSDMFVDLIQEDPQLRDLYTKSHQLCRKHFIEALKRCKDQNSAAFLVNDMLGRLNDWKDDFELYFHKIDYRFSDEPKGEEQNAWRKALHHYSSNKKPRPKP